MFVRTQLVIRVFQANQFPSVFITKSDEHPSIFDHFEYEKQIG